MKIGYVLNQYPTVSTSFILNEIRALRATGAEVVTYSVWPSKETDALSVAAREERASTVYLRPPRLGALLRSHSRALRRSPRRYAETLALALRLRPPGLRAASLQILYFIGALMVWDEAERRGIRHLHSHFSFNGCEIALLASHFGGGDKEPWSFSFTVHGPDEFSVLPTNRLDEKARRAAVVVAITNFARSQVLGLLDVEDWDKVRTVHCGIDPQRFRPVDRSGHRTDRLNILNVGRLVPVKGQAILIDAVANLVERGIDAHLTLVGTGPQEATLKRVVAERGLGDRVHLVGAVGQDDIGAYFAEADVFCVPSFAEGLPVVIMEALATELPVVSTAIMGIPELVEDGVTGRLVPPGDPNALADALEHLVEHPEERLRVGEAGRERVVERHDVAESGRQLAEIFSALPADD